MKIENMREEWRKDFPWTERMAYFRHAYNSPLPRIAIEKILQYFMYQSHLGFTGTDAYSKTDDTRKILANVIKANPEEIAHTQSYTEGLNIATSNINWKGKTNVVVGEADYFTTIIHLVHLLKRKKNVKLRVIPMDEDGFYMVDKAKDLIDGETALVHLVYVPNSVGTIQPVRKIFDHARKMGALTITDAAQSTGQVPHKVRDLNCDFYSCSGFKWLMGPIGTSFFWCRKELIEDIEPLIVGNNVINNDHNEVNLLKTAKRFDSSHNQPGIIGLGASTRYLSKIGEVTVEDSIKEISKYLINELIEECDANIRGTKYMEGRTGITCFTLKGINVADIVNELKFKYFVPADGPMLAPMMKVFSGRVVRVSTHFYNSHSDVDRLIQALKEIKK